MKNIKNSYHFFTAELENLSIVIKTLTHAIILKYNDFREINF